MDPILILPYLCVILVLVFLEGLLAADNSVVMAVMVKHLPPEQRKKALFYGLLVAFVFRFLALLLISVIANLWF
ncbi:TerC family protein, partial [Staphylococcus haemolyticus]|uniref:TerC family protein n=1 Tax=Staphylococcus haemolyticus TaxID=1283 RepID=UPI003B766A93